MEKGKIRIKMEKVSRDQLLNLKEEMNRHDVIDKMILSLLGIEKLTDLSISQYNILLYLIKN